MAFVFLPCYVLSAARETPELLAGWAKLRGGWPAKRPGLQYTLLKKNAMCMALGDAREQWQHEYINEREPQWTFKFRPSRLSLWSISSQRGRTKRPALQTRLGVLCLAQVSCWWGQGHGGIRA